MECVRRAMLARFERVCNGEEPICPWMLLVRNSSHPTRQPADDDLDNDDNNTRQQQQQQPSMTTTCCPFQGNHSLLAERCLTLLLRNNVMANKEVAYTVNT